MPDIPPLDLGGSNVRGTERTQASPGDRITPDAPAPESFNLLLDKLVTGGVTSYPKLEALTRSARLLDGSLASDKNDLAVKIYVKQGDGFIQAPVKEKEFRLEQTGAGGSATPLMKMMPY